MDPQVYFSTAAIGEPTFTCSNHAAVEQFDNALNTCVSGWQRGNDAIVLDDNIQELFGEVLLRYFKDNLVTLVGQPVTFTVLPSNGSSRTVVQMPKNKMPHLISQLQSKVEIPQAQASENTASKTDTVTTGVKKAPRPMNCWIIFRDTMHKKLKAENPDLTVRDICKHTAFTPSQHQHTNHAKATRCSDIWHALSPAEKTPWQAAAKSAKDEHLRQHPDYKYSPRKPGQKKKRQSRKAKRAAMAAAGTKILDFNSVSSFTQSPVETNMEPAVTADAVPADTVDSFVNDAAQIADPIDLFDFNIPDEPMNIDFLRDAETLRHDRLEAEFGAAFDMEMPFDMFGDDALAFRAGANNNVTLPGYYSDDF
jgi:hypothetical protein